MGKQNIGIASENVVLKKYFLEKIVFSTNGDEIPAHLHAKECHQTPISYHPEKWTQSGLKTWNQGLYKKNS